MLVHGRIHGKQVWVSFKRKWRMRFILFLGVIFPSQIVADPAPMIEWREFTPTLSDAVLFNAGMGLYLAGGSGLSYKTEPDAWGLSLADIVYFRPSWNDLEADAYDISRSGTWQRLEGTFETSLETVGGHLALERDTNATTTEIDLWLDSVELELLEAP
jgi:hypothetical protein